MSKDHGVSGTRNVPVVGWAAAACKMRVLAEFISGLRMQVGRVSAGRMQLKSHEWHQKDSVGMSAERF